MEQDRPKHQEGGVATTELPVQRAEVDSIDETAVTVYIIPDTAAHVHQGRDDIHEVIPANHERPKVRKAWKPDPDSLVRSPAGQAVWELKKQRRDTRPLVEPLR